MTYRYNHRKPLIMTTNLSQEVLSILILPGGYGGVQENLPEVIGMRALRDCSRCVAT